MMENKKHVLGIVFLVLSLMLWHVWQREHHSPVPKHEQQVSQLGIPTSFINPVHPQMKHTLMASSAAESSPASSHHAKIHVKTDVLDVWMDPQGGFFSQVHLLRYPTSLRDRQPIAVLTTQGDQFYVAQSGFVGRGLPQTPLKLRYTSPQKHYFLAPHQQRITVHLRWHGPSGIDVVKNLTFRRGEYAVKVASEVINHSSTAWEGHFYAQIRRKKDPHIRRGLTSRNYDGGAIYTDKKPYEKLSYEHLVDHPLNQYIRGGWLAMQQRYFLSVWIPDQKKMTNNHYYSHVSDHGIYTLGLMGPALQLAPGASQHVMTTLYVGPELEKPLKALAKGLHLTIDYGWLWIISEAIFWIMQHIYNIVGNWGIAIVLVTVLIKLLFFKLSETSYRSMAKMRHLQPRIEALRKQYENQREQLSRAMIDFYRKEKINPLGGCLPMLVQLPFFFALYYVLIESVQLRQAPFLFWIQDLSSKDPFYVLPILMGVSMLLQQKLSPQPADPTQAKVMMILPIVFTALFMSFPAGLVLYWLINNCLSALQQWYITQKLG